MRESGTSNPITRARESIGMSFSDLVIASKGSVSNLWNAEKGFHIRPPRQVVEALALAGADVAGIEAEYKAWRKSEARATIQKFAAAAGARG